MIYEARGQHLRGMQRGSYRNAVSVFLADTLSFCLALLEWVLVLELRSHGCWCFV